MLAPAAIPSPTDRHARPDAEGRSTETAPAPPPLPTPSLRLSVSASLPPEPSRCPSVSSPDPASLLESLSHPDADLHAIAEAHAITLSALARWLQQPDVQDSLDALRRLRALHRQRWQEQVTREAVEALRAVMCAADDDVTRRRAASAILREFHRPAAAPAPTAPRTPSLDRPRHPGACGHPQINIGAHADNHAAPRTRPSDPVSEAEKSAVAPPDANNADEKPASRIPKASRHRVPVTPEADGPDRHIDAVEPRDTGDPHPPERNPARPKAHHLHGTTAAPSSSPRPRPSGSPDLTTRVRSAPPDRSLGPRTNRGSWHTERSFGRRPGAQRPRAPPLASEPCLSEQAQRSPATQSGRMSPDSVRRGLRSSSSVWPAFTLSEPFLMMLMSCSGV
jgi:hypothetical protein